MSLSYDGAGSSGSVWRALRSNGDVDESFLRRDWGGRTVPGERVSKEAKDSKREAESRQLEGRAPLSGFIPLLLPPLKSSPYIPPQ